MADLGQPEARLVRERAGSGYNGVRISPSLALAHKHDVADWGESLLTC